MQENENAPEASLTTFPEFIEGIQDISVGTEILLFTWLHKADRSVMKTKPRNNPEAPLTGIFSTRSPGRPNPIGLHAVKVLSISEEGLIKVSGLEVIDQTPLIDIKPVWYVRPLSWCVTITYVPTEVGCVRKRGNKAGTFAWLAFVCLICVSCKCV